MYRAVTFYALQQRFISKDFFDSKSLISNLDEISLDFVFNEDLGYAEMYLNGVNVEREIRSMEVSSFVSKVAAVSEVRAKLVQQQQVYGKNKGVVMDGRDIGTVVFPDAELKIFMTASSEVRAQRRYLELIEKGAEVTLEEVLKNVQQRDEMDTNRKDAPLIQAVDAVVVDNSELTREEQFDLIYKLVQERLAI